MSEPRAVVLEAQGLERRFREGSLDVPVLKGVDLQIRHGDQIAVVGASGSGKSTLLQLLGGLDLPTGGRVSIHGEDWSAMSDTRRGVMRNRHLGFVYQFHHLLPEFTALENVAIPLMIRGLSTRRAQAEAADWLGKVDLAERERHKPSELSGGERQRVAIARAMVTRPAVILADEPTGNLDRDRAGKVFALLQAMNRETGTALVLVTHDPALAARMDRTLHLTDGQLQGAGD
ncbi:ABC transporter ATP-binding protein [Thioalkalivibrio paradoxus]|uniref:ABC transporter ATP-binding protein n=1 Tax=Thioalkalivibrio paradoxus ARh 1 TaxID=713585 RepID=W0DHW9_9GAMM|nr:ATP-binding cassette domain-containing protein [Thioalkalivibrio paradoxus]AHE98199.1 ABC transporter ATP-binding protein [Thioalkalivibrio paradoxus ARh 1]